MPSLNVITWNSMGETPAGAYDLVQVINRWQRNLIVIQGANAIPGGAIDTMLSGLTSAYKRDRGSVVDAVYT
jgi:hypothetical protein